MIVSKTSRPHRAYKPDFDEELLQKAYSFPRASTSGRLQLGEPYLIHPLNVAYILRTCGGRDLHRRRPPARVLEDTLTTKETLHELFGDQVAELVAA